MAINVLISSVSRKVWLVKAFQKALQVEKEGKVVAADIDPLSAGLYQSDVAYIVPRSTSKEFIPKMIQLCKDEEVDIIIPTRDEELMIYAKHKDDFKQAGTEVMVCSPETLEICSDKGRFVVWCKENGFSTPRTYSYQDVDEDDVKYPLFVKSRYGKGSRNVFKVQSKENLERIVSKLEEPIIQEFVDEKEYTIDLFADFDGRVISVIPRERVSTFGGESFKGRTHRHDTLITTTVSLANKLGLIGHNTIQCFFAGEEPKYIEVNPRYGGGANLGFAAGSLTPLHIVRLLKGEKVVEQIGDFKDELYMLRYTEDVFVEESDAERLKRID
jgi:carbamoyl-phosphate synthase large subunit